MAKKLFGIVPSWKTWLTIAVGVIMLRKLEIMLPQLANYTRTSWPIGGNA